MPRASSAARRRAPVGLKAVELPEALPDLPVPEMDNLLRTAYAWGLALLRWAWAFVWPILIIAALAWTTGVAHWFLMTIYSGMGCHTVSLFGFLRAALDQARPECVLTWRLAEVAHWSLFDLFGRILAMAVPAAA